MAIAGSRVPGGPRQPKSATAVSGAYAALLAREGDRQTRHTIVGGEMVERPNPLLESLRAGKLVTVNLFKVPKQFRPENVNLSMPVDVHPDDRIELW